MEERKAAERADPAVSRARSGKLLTEEAAEREISTITRAERTQSNSQTLHIKHRDREGSLSFYPERSERLPCTRRHLTEGEEGKTGGNKLYLCFGCREKV